MSLRSPARWLRIIADGLGARAPTNDVAKWMTLNMRFDPPSPFPGPFDPSRHPAQLGPMEWLGPMSTATIVTPMWGAQMGKTTTIQGFLGQGIDERPGPFRVVVPDVESVGQWQTEKAHTLFAVVDAFSYLRERTHDRQHKVGSIEFVGGALTIRAAGTKQTFAADSIRCIVLDDVDRAPATAEGDIVALAAGRTTTYHLSGAKVLVVSTPTTVSGVVYQSWLTSSQRKYWVPCRHCGAFQTLEPHRMRWTPGDYRSVHMVCAHGACGKTFTQRDMQHMLQLGEWRAGRPEMVGIHEGCHLWAAHVPYEMYSWAEYAREFELAETAQAAGNEKKMQTFTNQRQGLPYSYASDKRLDDIGKKLLLRVTNTPQFVVDELPLNIVVVGTDVQTDRIESTIAGYGAGFETWVLGYRVHKGHYTDPVHWREWAQWIIGMTPKVQAVCVDGNFRYSSKDAPGLNVLQQIRSLYRVFLEAGIAVWITRGQGGPASSLWPSPRAPMNTPGADQKLVSIRVDHGKDWVYGSLKAWADGKLTSGPNMIHIDRTVLTIDGRGARFFVRSLMSEREARAEDRVGQTKYIPIAKKIPTEVLDTVVLTRAAVEAYAGALDDGNRSVFLASMNPQPASAPPVPVAAPIAQPRAPRERTELPSDWTL